MIVDLSKIPKQAVYLVIDKVARSFYVGYTLNMGGALPMLYEMAARLPALELSVLTSTSDYITLRLHTEYYRNIYLDMGCSELIVRGRKALEYRVRVMVAPDFKYVDVELVTARGDEMVVARFKTKKEANEFTLMYYGDDNPYRFPVYAANADTKALLQGNEKTEKLNLYI